jgi:hypothetical protein
VVLLTQFSGEGDPGPMASPEQARPDSTLNQGVKMLASPHCCRNVVVLQGVCPWWWLFAIGAPPDLAFRMSMGNENLSIMHHSALVRRLTCQVIYSRQLAHDGLLGFNA